MTDRRPRSDADPPTATDSTVRLRPTRRPPTRRPTTTAARPIDPTRPAPRSGRDRPGAPTRPRRPPRRRRRPIPPAARSLLRSARVEADREARRAAVRSLRPRFSRSSSSAPPSCRRSRAGSSAPTPASQQVATVDGPRYPRLDPRPQRRGAGGLRGGGDGLRDPVPGGGSAEDRAQARGGPRRLPPTTCSSRSRDRDNASSGFEYLAHKVDLVTADKIAEARPRRDRRSCPTPGASTPQDKDGARLIGAVGDEGQGLFGIEASEDDVLAGTDGEVAVDQRRARPGDRPRRRSPARSAGHDVAAHDRRQDPGLHGDASSTASASTYQPEGATAVVMDPRQRRRAGDGELAAGRPDRPRRRRPGRSSTNMADRLHLRAGLDLQGLHRRRRARRTARHPDTTFDLPADRSRSPTGRSRRPRARRPDADAADILAQSSNVGAVTIGDEARRARSFDNWVHRFGFGQPTGIDYPGEEQGIVPPRRLLRLDASATCRSARASRSPRCR